MVRRHIGQHGQRGPASPGKVFRRPASDFFPVGCSRCRPCPDMRYRISSVAIAGKAYSILQCSRRASPYEPFSRCQHGDSAASTLRRVDRVCRLYRSRTVVRIEVLRTVVRKHGPRAIMPSCHRRSASPSAAIVCFFRLPSDVSLISTCLDLTPRRARKSQAGAHTVRSRPVRRLGTMISRGDSSSGTAVSVRQPVPFGT